MNAIDRSLIAAVILVNLIFGVLVLRKLDSIEASIPGGHTDEIVSEIKELHFDRNNPHCAGTLDGISYTLDSIDKRLSERDQRESRDRLFQH